MGRLVVAAPVVVPGSVLARGVTSRVPEGVAGLAGWVCCAVWLGGVVPVSFTVPKLLSGAKRTRRKSDATASTTISPSACLGTLKPRIDADRVTHRANALKGAL